MRVDVISDRTPGGVADEGASAKSKIGFGEDSLCLLWSDWGRTLSSERAHRELYVTAVEICEDIRESTSTFMQKKTSTACPLAVMYDFVVGGLEAGVILRAKSQVGLDCVSPDTTQSQNTCSLFIQRVTVIPVQ